LQKEGFFVKDIRGLVMVVSTNKRDEVDSLFNKFLVLCEKIVVDEGLCLYDMEYKPKQAVLRVFIFDNETKTALLEDCIKVDRALGPFLESEAWVPENIVLEVSSPGVYRSLKSKRHFHEALGAIVKVKLLAALGTTGALDGRSDLKRFEKATFLRGLLEKVSEEELEIKEHDTDIVINIRFDQIKAANVDPDWDSHSD
jgi:ribosome maturation factor RimP